jgi:exopolysaccharide transport family protein
MPIGRSTQAHSTRPSDVGRSDELQRLIATFRRRSRAFIATVLIILATAVLLTLQQAPRYTATANVMVDTRKHSVTEMQDVLSGLPADSSAVDTEVEILKSRALAERVVAAEKLDLDSEFNTALRPPGGLGALIRAPIDALKALASSQASHTQTTAALKATKIHEGVVDRVLGRLKVRRTGLSYVIALAFESGNAAKAADIANAFAELYLTQQLQDKYDATKQANQWLNARLTELQPQVAQAEAAVEQYKAQHGLLASVGSSLTEQEISNLNNQLAQAKADEAEKDARVRTAEQEARAGSSGENLSGVLTSGTISQLRVQQTEASSKVADLQTKYGPRHPDVQRAQRQLADITTQISQEIGRQVSGLQAEDSVARKRVASLEGSLAGAKGTLVGNNAASVELDDLQRKATAASTLYDALLNRAKQTSTDQGAETSDSRIVSRAKIPTGPSYPNKPLNFALGLLLGIAGGIGMVFVLEALDNVMTTSEDVELMLHVPHLGAIPVLGSTTTGKPITSAPGDYVVEKPLSAFAEAFRTLRTSIVFSKVDTQAQVILLTSALPGEGKTTTAFCLGRSAALSGSNVIVVDCDLRRRYINRLLKIEPATGLVEVLQGAVSLSEAIVHDEASGAHFLPLAHGPHTPKDLFGSKAMERLIKDLRERFDLVILDTSPVLPVADTRSLAPHADAVVFLVRWRKTPLKAVEAAFSLIRSVGVEIVGVALTRVDARLQAKYGYGDSGYYYSAYRKYYG